MKTTDKPEHVAIGEGGHGSQSTSIPESWENNPAESSGEPKIKVQIHQPEHGAILFATSDGAAIQSQSYNFRATAVHTAKKGSFLGKIDWQSSLDGSLGSGPEIPVELKNTGNHKISATATWLSSQATATVGIKVIRFGTDGTEYAGEDTSS